MYIHIISVTVCYKCKFVINECVISVFYCMHVPALSIIRWSSEGRGGVDKCGAWIVWSIAGRIIRCLCWKFDPIWWTQSFYIHRQNYCSEKHNVSKIWLVCTCDTIFIHTFKNAFSFPICFLPLLTGMWNCPSSGWYTNQTWLTRTNWTGSLTACPMWTRCLVYILPAECYPQQRKWNSRLPLPLQW